MTLTTEDVYREIALGTDPVDPDETAGNPSFRAVVDAALAIGRSQAAAANEEEIRRDERHRTAEAIARAIEVAHGRRCPECGGLPASGKWKGLTLHGRCGAGHRWVARDWAGGAEIARRFGDGGP